VPRLAATKVICWLEGAQRMEALVQLGMVSDLPSDAQTDEIRSADTKDYFVQRNGVRYAGTHLDH
jgi:hypothetical protein